MERKESHAAYARALRAEGAAVLESGVDAKSLRTKGRQGRASQL
jgi:hypothetical protein